MYEYLEDDAHEDDATYTWDQRITASGIEIVVHCPTTDNHGYAEILRGGIISICTWHGADGEDDAMYALRDGSDDERAKATSTDAMLALVEMIRALYAGYVVRWEATDARRARVYKMIARRLGLGVRGLGCKQGVRL